MIDWNNIKAMGPRERVVAFAPLIQQLLEDCIEEWHRGARTLAMEMYGDPMFIPSQSQLAACVDSLQASVDDPDLEGNTLAGTVFFLATRLLPEQKRATLAKDRRFEPFLLDDDTVFDALIAMDESDDLFFDALR